MQMFSDKTLGNRLGSDWLSSGCREKVADYSSRAFGLQILSTPCSDPTPWNFYPKSTLPQIPSNFLISATHGMRSHTLCIFSKCSSADQWFLSEFEPQAPCSQKVSLGYQPGLLDIWTSCIWKMTSRGSSTSKKSESHPHSKRKHWSVQTSP